MDMDNLNSRDMFPLCVRFSELSCCLFQLELSDLIVIFREGGKKRLVTVVIGNESMWSAERNETVPVVPSKEAIGGSNSNTSLPVSPHHITLVADHLFITTHRVDVAIPCACLSLNQDPR